MKRVKVYSSDKVFMYHSIVPSGKDSDLNPYDVSLKSFTQQMEFLKKRGYYVQTYPPNASRSVPTNKPRAVITFDDGLMNNFKDAFPVLENCGFSAYFFVIVERIGRPGYMGWNELKNLQQAGMTIGSHGMSHKILVKLETKEIKRELSESRKILEQNLATKIAAFSVPGGFYNEEVLEIARDSGYEQIFISDEFVWSPLCVGRMCVAKDWTLEHFEMALQGEKLLNETIAQFCKSNLKTLLGGRWYHNLRSFMVKHKK